MNDDDDGDDQTISKDKCTSIFSRQLEAIMFIIFKMFTQRAVKMLRTAYCLLRGIFTFQCLSGSA